MKERKVIGTFAFTQGSDVVGDDCVGTEIRFRLSEPQVKYAFVVSQKETGTHEDDILLDLDELLECIARCGVCKYKSVEQIATGGKVSGIIANILGDLTEEQVIHEATYVKAERFVPPLDLEGFDQERAEEQKSWVALWEKLSLSTLPGFPLWERDVHDALHASLTPLQSIFRAYAAAPLGKSADMDMEEFRDFVVDTKLATDEYGFDTMSGQFVKANGGDSSSQGSGSNDLELHEFLTMLVHISFFRANPQYGMRKGDDRKVIKNVGMNEKNADKFGKEVKLPDCLRDMLTNNVLPFSRRDSDAHEFTTKTLKLPEVQAVLKAKSKQISELFEMISAGRTFMELDQWLEALQSKVLLTDVVIKGSPIRLSEPQAKAFFYASAAKPAFGLAPEELPACIARCGCEKYKQVTQMGAGIRVTAFVCNLLGLGDEEDMVRMASAQ